jgi:His-Xaa-Ser system radical SAM maturase HxsB
VLRKAAAGTPLKKSTRDPVRASSPSIDPSSFDPVQTGFFRFRRLDGKYLITNDFGRYRLLTDAEFQAFIAGTLDKTAPLYGRLAEDGFIRDRMDLDALAAGWGKRNRFLWQGPNLHVVVVTLRCNHRCLYCQASAGSMRDVGFDMSLETAEKVVNRIFESPSRSITIEFQGGEPLANWPVVEFIIDYARKKNLEAGKSLWLSLVSNLTLMDDAKLKFLLKNQVSICTSLDGPADLHNKNRLYAGGNSHAEVVGWFKKIAAKTSKKTFRIEALLTVTRYSLSRHKEIVDEYVRLGSRGVFLRSLSPLGLAHELWDRIGYTAEEFLEFYRKAFDYILAINKKKLFVEQTARIFLAKMLTDVDPNFLDVRSPCGAGVGQIAYNFDGGVYTCDEGRMFARMGDESFRIGSVAEGTYQDTVSHPAVKALSVASLLDTQPDCSRCAYKPYCGVCPIQCYAEQGDIMGRMPTNTRCRIHKGIMDHLFEKLQDPGNEEIFRKWVRRKEEASTYQRL